jgi:hypothetical protein
MFDPNLPQENTLADAAQMRAQFNALNDRIDGVPGITSVVVDSVTTVGPGQPASVTVSVVGTVLHLILAIPEGQPGAQGVQGQQGPPFANVIIDNVTTVNPGEPAAVFISFDGINVHLAFAIPRGMQGEQGIQGPPGEVTTAAMDGAISSAIAGTSNNTNAVALLNLTVSDPPTQAEMQAIANKIDEMITAQRR